jgi:uncharacterized membrane protein
MWSAIGIILCVVVTIVALAKSKRAQGSYYEREVYGMTARTHRAYASLSVIFAALFVASLFAPLPTIPLLAAYALVFIFYFSSFARGFSDEE